DRRALLISENVLTVRQYDDLGVTSSGQIDWNAAETTWATSDVRAWLNGEFLNATFNTELQEAIAPSPIVNPDNLESGAAGGENTEDRIFLLSIDEAERYFADDGDRIASLTMAEADIEYGLSIYRDYFGWAQENLDTHESTLRDGLNKSQAHSWLLRSPGYHGSRVAIIGSDGHLEVNGDFVNDYDGIRPALWLDL
ncbi:MAG: DUF6273 domain-containing protein, partial [Coriobacteriales bacterium]|nr:DUF6273 domain-containing protein [Coriobacteriales bacterium]